MLAQPSDIWGLCLLLLRELLIWRMDTREEKDRVKQRKEAYNTQGEEREGTNNGETKEQQKTTKMEGRPSRKHSDVRKQKRHLSVGGMNTHQHLKGKWEWNGSVSVRAQDMREGSVLRDEAWVAGSDREHRTLKDSLRSGLCGPKGDWRNVASWARFRLGSVWVVTLQGTELRQYEVA